MATGRQLTEQGRERKQQLLEQAVALFAERGYANTRIADICTAAGVAKGLFYWYFENKEQLFADLVRDRRVQLRRMRATAIDPKADVLTQIRQGTEASVRFMSEHQAFFSLLDVLYRSPELAAVIDEGTEVHVSDTARMIAEAQRTGLVPDDADPRDLAYGVVGTVSWFCHYHRTGKLSVDVDELAAMVGRFVVRAVAAADVASGAAVTGE